MKTTSPGDTHYLLIWPMATHRFKLPISQPSDTLLGLIYLDFSITQMYNQRKCIKSAHLFYRNINNLTDVHDVRWTKHAPLKQIYIITNLVIFLSNAHLPNPFLLFLGYTVWTVGVLGFCGHSYSPWAGAQLQQGTNAKAVQRSIKDTFSKTYRTWHAQTFSKLGNTGGSHM